MSSEPFDRAALAAAGWTVLRTKSYNQAREKLRVAECAVQYEREHNQSTTAWAQRAFDEQRRLGDRLTFVYGKAIEHGATADELKSDPTP